MSANTHAIRPSFPLFQEISRPLRSSSVDLICKEDPCSEIHPSAASATSMQSARGLSEKTLAKIRFLLSSERFFFPTLTCSEDSSPAGLEKTIGSFPEEVSSPLLELPDEVKGKIFSSLNIRDVGVCAKACRTLNAFLTDNHIWKGLFKRDFSHWEQLPPSTVFRDLYKEACTFYSNLKKDIYATQAFGVENSVPMLSLFVDAGVLYSGSASGEIQAWDIETSQCIRTYTGHPGSAVHVLLVCEQILCSGSADYTIKLWALETGECLGTFKGHTGAICSMINHKQVLYSGSEDFTIQSWDLKTRQHKATFKGHTGKVTSVVFFGTQLCSSSEDGTIKMWNVLTGTYKNLYSNKSMHIHSIAVANGKFFSGHSVKQGINVWNPEAKHTIRVWNLKTETCEKIVTGFKTAVNFLVGARGILCSRSMDYSFTVWSEEKGRYMNTFQGRFEIDNRRVSSLAIAHGVVYTGYESGTIKARDFHSSEKRVFKDIANLFRAIETRGDVGAQLDSLLWRFGNMPRKAKEKIYQKLHDILKAQGGHSYKTDFLAFSTLRLSTTPPVLEMAQAIDAYLEDLALLNRPQR